jgi:hypothetical protein
MVGHPFSPTDLDGCTIRGMAEGGPRAPKEGYRALFVVTLLTLFGGGLLMIKIFGFR